MAKPPYLMMASVLVLALPAFAVHAESTGEAPAPEATNPPPARELNQTDQQKAMPPGKDTGPETGRRSGSGDSMRTDSDAAREREQGSGASGKAAPRSVDPEKPAR